MRHVRKLLLAACLLAAGACSIGTANDDSQRFPTSSAYPPGTMERFSFEGGNAEHWRISALRTPERPDAHWKVVILTGTPSWSEYWAPTLAAAPADWEVVVADRPGFRDSQPDQAVGELMQQVEALSPMLEARPGQRVLLIGQSFGAPIATLMAARYPDKVDAVVMVSAFFGDRGPTARRMIGAGQLVHGMLPRDLRNSISEITAQDGQLPSVWEALRGLRQPVVFIHGDADTFVPLAADQRIAAAYGHTLITAPGGDHFLNACCVPALIGAIQQAMSEADNGESAAPATAAATPASPHAPALQ